jgi:hypothetical protein
MASSWAEEMSSSDTIEFISIYGIVCLGRKEAIAMGRLRFADLQTRSTEVLDLTSLMLAKFQRLVPPFEGAFQAHMVHWHLDWRPRTARRYTAYKNSPLPTLEDPLPFILIYLKTHPLRVVHRRLFGMSVHEMRSGLKWHGDTFSGCRGSCVHGRNLGTSAPCSDGLPCQEDPHGRARCRDEYRIGRAGSPDADQVYQGTCREA